MAILTSLHHVTRYTLRPAGRARAAGHPAAAGAALPHHDPQLFAQGHAGQPFRELAAGPARQLAGALRFPGEGHRVHDRGRPRRRHGGRSIRSTSSSSRTPRDGRSPIPPSWRDDLAPYLDAEPAGPLRSRRSSPTIARASGRARSTSSSTSTQRLQREIGYIIRMEPGVQTPEETLERGAGSCRDTAGCWCRCCAISASRRASSRAT